MSIELNGKDFGEYYHSHDCGIPYERTEHWLSFFDKIADRIVKELEPKSVLDAGCAWGFLVEALRNRGVQAWGIDISEYAISNVHESIKGYCKVGSITEPFEHKYDLIVNIEVLEHMQQVDAVKAIKNFSNATNRVLFSSTPFDYTEATHINVQPPEYWSKEFALHGFYRDIDFDGSFLTSWTSLFTKQDLSKSQLLTQYERRFWSLQKENVDLRHHILSDQATIDRLESDSERMKLEFRHLKNLLESYQLKLSEWNGLWHALQTSRTWKVLKKLGRFREFPSIGLELPELNLDATESIISNGSIPDQETNTSKKKLTSYRTFFKVGNWRFDALNGVTNLAKDGSFEAYNFDPQFFLIPVRRRFPRAGNYLLCANISSPQSVIEITLYFDVGFGLNEKLKVRVSAETNQLHREIIRIPEGVRKIRIDIGSIPGKIRIVDFSLQKISTWMTLRKAYDSFKPRIQTPGDLIHYALKGVRLLFSSGGIEQIKQKIFIYDRQNYTKWLNLYGEITTEMETEMKAKMEEFAHEPLFSILLPTYNSKQKWLLDAIQSVRDQIYPNWELCISDDCSTASIVRDTIEQLAAEDNRIKYVFREINGHISANTNSALEIAEGEFVVLLDHDDELTKDALYQAAAVLQNHRDANYIYSDEDKITEQGERYDPYFKPDWNPELLHSQNYLSHLSIIRRSVLNQIGGFRIGFEGSQDWDVALRVTQLVPAESIVHIPHVLYHWRAVSGSTAKATDQKSYIEESQYKTLQAHFNALQIPVTISLSDVQYWDIEYPIPDPQPLVSIIVPTKNQKKLLQKCIDSILSLTTYRNFEILVVDNRTDEDEAKKYLNSISAHPEITVLEYDKEFNFSGINNFAVSKSRGSLVVLMNNDIEVLTENWLEEMVSLAIRENTGAVGAKLLYPNRTIQHAGVILGVGGVANHAYLDSPADVIGQMGRARIVQNMSAVTAACLAIEKRKFLGVGGFNEVDLKIAFNDVDLCLKLLEAGYRNVWTPNAVFIHHESVSRGQEDTPSKQARFASEVQYMLDSWKDLLENDPAYNPNLSIERADFSFSFPPRVGRV